MEKKSCMHCYVSGKVQGVWFRASAKQEAEKLKLKGWARNLSDGRVEVFACGELNQLELFHAWLQKGPELAQVSDCTRFNSEWQELLDFRIS